MPTRLVARAVRGIEDLVADEVHSRGVGRVAHIGHREIQFTAADPAAALTALRTADDVLLLVARVPDIGDTKADLERLRRGLRSRLPATQARRFLAIRRRLGGADPRPGIDVSASFLGRRNFGRFDIEDAVGGYLEAVLGMAYHSRRSGARPPSGTCSWRVTLDGGSATIGLRVSGRPSHRRGYKRASVPGSLHPPLAAAMVRLAGIRAGDTVVDPCCGAGTLLVETGLAVPGSGLVGVDWDAAALRAARENAGPLSARWLLADAAALPLAAASAHHVLVNPPWGRQAPAHGALAGCPQRLWAQARRVLRPGGRLVALLHDEDQVRGAMRDGFTVEHVRSVRVSGALATIAVLR